MKTLISTLAISTIFSLQVNASHLGSDFNVRAFNNQTLTVQFDQINYGNVNTEFTINDVNPGRHRLTIWSKPFNNFHRRNHTPVLLYNGFVDLNPQTITSAIVTPNHRLNIISVEPKCINTIVYNQYGSSYHNNGNSPSHCLPLQNTYGMMPAQFEQLKNSIARKNFDSTRLLLARQAVHDNLLNSRQVAELISLMDFESSKMDLAKFAYSYTIDPQNYYVIYDLFSFESSISELSNFIDRHS